MLKKLHPYFKFIIERFHGLSRLQLTLKPMNQKYSLSRINLNVKHDFDLIRRLLLMKKKKKRQLLVQFKSLVNSRKLMPLY